MFITAKYPLAVNNKGLYWIVGQLHKNLAIKYSLFISLCNFYLFIRFGTEQRRGGRHPAPDNRKGLPVLPDNAASAELLRKLNFPLPFGKEKVFFHRVEDPSTTGLDDLKNEFLVNLAI